MAYACLFPFKANWFGGKDKEFDTILAGKGWWAEMFEIQNRMADMQTSFLGTFLNISNIHTVYCVLFLRCVGVCFSEN